VSEDTSKWSTASGDSLSAEDPAKAEPGTFPEVGRLSFEQALAELESIVQDLERAQLDLDAAIAAYERGIALKRHCESKLREAQLRVESISLGDDGAPRATPVDFSSGR
jgi:exodeoxyribonuclease VII small subunit